MMKKQYEMPSLYVLAFSSNADVITGSPCEETGGNLGGDFQTFNMKNCGPLQGGGFGDPQ
ncbi:hypothetical protein [Bifidobacterium jacchi]|uniref:Uncharacterized protein n=1 Tax=Bifidobacterium jacchi TaxID=2490545 RepID=A0A5N5RDP3_9BIFI|nr:hypothetical protein [Bifidobacterium jacchi]KAB5605386.1 hypothetical protein EHS19_09300 [Bifidobacterium jacchi]